MIIYVWNIFAEENMICDKTYPVYAAKAESYDAEKIKSIFESAFCALNIDIPSMKGKKVVIKPNFVMKKSPEFAATTHPAVIEALLCILEENGISPVIAESPGGVYSAARLSAVYRECGAEEIAKKHGCVLNSDVTYKNAEYKNGKKAKNFEIITPIYDADVIFDMSKLKSHSLTVLSGAIKNFYGTIPGIVKFEMHAAYPDYEDFALMVCDLCSMICQEKQVISITDAIIGMEGEGPTGGTPKKIGAILVSKSPFLSDAVAAKLLCVVPENVPMIKESIARGYVPENTDEINIIGDGIAPVEDFGLSKSYVHGALSFFSTGLIGSFFTPRPYITNKCRGCGECVRSCPEHTIILSGGRAKIDSKKCIRCFCCQELCPFVAIKTRRNPILNIITKIK